MKVYGQVVYFNLKIGSFRVNSYLAVRDSNLRYVTSFRSCEFIFHLCGLHSHLSGPPFRVYAGSFLGLNPWLGYRKKLKN